YVSLVFYFFFQAEDGIRDRNVTGVQTCALPIFYLVIESIYGIRYDFRMPAILSIATVVVTLRISRTDAAESLGKASLIVIQLVRSEERRVGKECRCRWEREENKEKEDKNVRQ